MKKHDLQFEEFASDVLRGEEQDFVEVPISMSMFLFAGICIAGLISLIIGRVIFLNIVQGDFYQARAETNMNREKPVPAHRGIITDRFGTVLAKNTETFSVFLNVGDLLRDRKELTAVVSQLSETLNISAETLEEIIKSGDYENKSEVPVVRNITSEEAIAVRGLNLAAVTVENDFRREYADGPAFASILGYTGTSDKSANVVGKAGLERYFDAQLRGTDGVYVYHRDAKGNLLDERPAVDAVPGQTLTTTIDAGLQKYFYNRLQAGLRSLGVRSAVGIAMDPKTGEVLSMVSLPTYDNNIFMTPGTSKERVALFNDNGRPLFNRAINGAYNPGSTIKPMVALAALHEGVITPNTTVYSKGYIEIPNPYVPDKPSRFVEFNQEVLGTLNVRSAIARSSNVFFYTAGGGFEGMKGLGINRLNSYWQKFGLGSKTGIEADNENVGFLPSSEEKEQRTKQPWRIGDTYNVSIGQGDLRVSPLQLINFTASLANDGIMYRPSLIKSIGGVQELQDKPVLDYSTWTKELTEVQAGMRDGVSKTYGRSNLLHNLPFTSAAKTGSAQIANNTKTNALFIGYAPYEDPQIAVLILIENAVTGSLNAVPIAKDVLNWYYENRIAKGAPVKVPLN